MSDRANLVRVLTASTGTSTMTLGAVYSQLFMTPAEAGMIDGRTYTYLIIDGNDWELGKGVYTSSGSTLSRVTVLASRISGTLGTTKVTLSGTAQVRIIESADDMGALRGTRPVTGTSDAIANSDLGRAVKYNNASAIAVTLAQAGASSQFLDGWSVWVKNIGAGAVTITPATSTINGAASFVLAQNLGAFIWSDGTNYQGYIIPITKPLLAANNLSDVANALTALGNLNGVSYGGAQSLTAAQKAQARANIDALKKNYIINGAMMVSQENGASAGTVTGYYAVDQFPIFFGNGGALSVAQVASATSGGSPNRLRVTVTTADASVAAGDYAYVTQKIEGFRAADLLFGTASAKTIILSFGVKAPAGTYCVVFTNDASNRSYVAEYVISGGEANTDVIKSVTIAGDTSGTWLKDSSGSGVSVRWGLMAGSTFQQAANSWGTGNVLGSSSQFNFMGTNGNVFELFDVGLYEGTVAPVFQVPDYASELLQCQRYFAKGSARIKAWTTASDNLIRSVDFPTRMRATPSVTLSGTTYTNASGIGTTVPADNTVITIYATATTGAMADWSTTWTASARL